MDIVQILNQFLAPLFDRFKASNPTVAGILAVVLIIINMNIDPILTSFGIVNASLVTTIKLLLFTIAALLGSRTQQFMNKDAETGL
jgi:uncharacterized membrane protein YvlD (DUF360 family)